MHARRGVVTMEQPCMRAYSLLLIKTCHRRGVHAMGGMAAQIPVKNNPQANEAALAKVPTFLRLLCNLLLYFRLLPRLHDPTLCLLWARLKVQSCGACGQAVFVEVVTKTACRHPV